MTLFVFIALGTKMILTKCGFIDEKSSVFNKFHV